MGWGRGQRERERESACASDKISILQLFNAIRERGKESESQSKEA